MNTPAAISLTENQLHYAAVDYLHKAAAFGVIYFHVPNEGDRSKGQQIHQYKLGLLPGFPDLCILKEGRAFVVEFKVGERSLSDEQWAVRRRCEQQGIPYAVVRTVERFIEIMKEWEMVR